MDRVIEEIGLKAMEFSSVLMPVLLALVKDNDSIVARQCIVSGTNFFGSVLEELAVQVSLSLSLFFCHTYTRVFVLGSLSFFYFSQFNNLCLF